jgi:hypothetical protein
MRALSVFGLAISCLAASLLGGCATLQDWSAKPIGCRPGKIAISNERRGAEARTWTASCGGRDYACRLTKGDDSSLVQCVPGETESWATPSEYPGPGGSVRGSVERAYDKERELHIVRGKLALTRGFELKVIGVPQLKLGMIAFVLSVNTKVVKLGPCSSFNIVVNEQPLKPLETSSQEKERTLLIESRYDFQSLAPLAQHFATFGAETCARAFKLTEAQVAELQKFLVIYAQIAAQVHDGDLPSKEGQPIDATPTSAPDAI